MKPTAYAIRDGDTTLPSDNEMDNLHVFRTGIMYAGTIRCSDPVPRVPSIRIPSFWIVGTDKESIKEEFSRQIDYIFDGINKPIPRIN